DDLADLHHRRGARDAAIDRDGCSPGARGRVSLCELGIVYVAGIGAGAGASSRNPADADAGAHERDVLARRTATILRVVEREAESYRYRDAVVGGRAAACSQ